MSYKYKSISIILALVVCITMCFGDIGAAHAFATDSEEDIDNTEITQDTEAGGEESQPNTVMAALAVYQDDNLIKTYDTAELQQMGDPNEYTYSAFNSYPSAKEAVDVKGVHVEDILKDALSVENLDNVLGDEQLIEIMGNDKGSMFFMKKQLLSERYYFPNFRNEAGRKGQKPLAASSTDKQAVPAIITLSEPNGASDEVGRLLFGQVTPAEQNNSAFVRYIVRGDKEFNTETGLVEGKNYSIGKIFIHSGNAPKLNALKTTTAGPGGAVVYGTVLMFDRGVNKNPTKINERYFIYYTTDGSTPDINSNLYNYNNFDFGKVNEQFYRPAISKEGTITIKTRVIGYGRQDSDVTTFHFTGVKKPATPKITKITTKKKAITLKWSKINGATGYKIYRATKKNGKYKLVKTITKGKTVTWKNSKLKKKKKYYYKIRAYKKVSGKMFYSSYSAVKYKKVK